MAKLQIITGENNPILRAKSVAVKRFDAGLKKFAAELKRAMAAADGVGIAAPQVGVNDRIFIATLGSEGKSRTAVAMVNPEISEESGGMLVAEEGCLSLPGQYGKVARHKNIVVDFQDLHGNSQRLNLSDMDARVVQHELDHLNGILFIDKLYKDEKVEDLLM